MRGSVDRLEGDIAVIVFDNGKIQDIKNTIGLIPGDRIKKSRGIIKLIDNKEDKEKMIKLQKNVFKKGGES